MSSQDSISSSSANNSPNFSDYVDQGMLFNSLLHSEENLPALNEGEFKTDNFRMYNFKVYPCRRTYEHVWSQCPFFHPGENAHRRDPRLYNYSPLQCHVFRTTRTCPKGDECVFAHGLFETWLHPAQYRTRICRDRGHCTRPLCFFAHDHLELRPIYKKTGSGEREFPTRPLPTASSIRPTLTMGNQNHHLSNVRMLENIRLGRSNLGLCLDDSTPLDVRVGRSNIGIGLDDNTPQNHHASNIRMLENIRLGHSNLGFGLDDSTHLNDQNHHISNIRMPENIKFGRSNLGIGQDDNTPLDYQNYHLSNTRMLENIRPGSSNLGLVPENNTPMALGPGPTSFTRLVQRPESYATSESYFSGGPFFDLTHSSRLG